MKKYGLFKIIFIELKTVRKEKSFGYYILLLLSTICGGIVPFITIVLSRVIIDYLTNGIDKNQIVTFILALCAIGLACEVVAAIIKNLFTGWHLDIRMKEFNKVNNLYLNMDYENVENSSFRDKMEAASQALEGDGIGFQHVLTLVSYILPLLFSVIVYCVFIGIFNYLVLIACLVSAVLVIFVNKKIALYIATKREEKAKRERQSAYFLNTSCDFSYGKDIRVYSLQNKIKADHKKKAMGVVSIVSNIENKRFGYGMLEILCLLLENAVAYYFIISNYLNGLITLGQVSMYIALVIAFSEAIRQLTDYVTDLIKDSKYVELYLELMNDSSLITQRGNKKAIDKSETLEIEFKNVSFKYPNTTRWILKDFNFKINKGEKLAIVGTNGAGKSTIVKLITGLFYPNEGEILINGINVQEFDKKELASMFSVVYQDINIYAASVIENVVGLDKTPEARNKAIDALNRVGLKEKLESLPNGYDTQLLKVIEDNGVELSGGQNQKICIARALYKDGNMVILDEPTSALDALAEASIYQSFDDLVSGKTAIYISHRLSSTKFCDKIALFNQDGLAEYGSHEELMQKKGEYYHMFEVQGKYYQEGGEQDEQ